MDMSFSMKAHFQIFFRLLPYIGSAQVESILTNRYKRCK